MPFAVFDQLRDEHSNTSERRPANDGDFGRLPVRHSSDTEADVPRNDPVGQRVSRLLQERGVLVDEEVGDPSARRWRQGQRPRLRPPLSLQGYYSVAVGRVARARVLRPPGRSLTLRRRRRNGSGRYPPAVPNPLGPRPAPRRIRSSRDDWAKPGRSHAQDLLSYREGSGRISTRQWRAALGHEARSSQSADVASSNRQPRSAWRRHGMSLATSAAGPNR